MKQFVLLPDAAQRLRKPFLTRMIFTSGIVLLIVLVAPMIMAGSADFDTSSLILMIMLVAMFAISSTLAYRRMKRSLESYKLTIAEDRITREMGTMPDLTILTKDIQQVCINSDGSYTIKGKSALNAIGVPASIDGKEELETLLTAIMPLTDKTKNTFWVKYSYFIGLLVVALLYCSYLITNKYVSTAAGVLFIGLMTYSWVAVQQSKNVSKRTKWASYLVILPILSAIVRLMALWE